MRDPWSLKPIGAKLALMLGLALWVGLMYLIYGLGHLSFGDGLGFALGASFACLAGTVKMIETANASHIEIRGNKTVLYYRDDDDPLPPGP